MLWILRRKHEIKLHCVRLVRKLLFTSIRHRNTDFGLRYSNYRNQESVGFQLRRNCGRSGNTRPHLADHSKAVKDFDRMGFGATLNTPYYGRETVFLRKGSEFKVKSFPLTDKDGNWMHTNADGSECPCYGFLIKHPELGRMLYITDTELVKWKFKDIDHILISCNYQSKYVTEEEQSKRKHVLRGHMELQTVIDFLKVNATDRLKTVTLCHLSDRNANAGEMLAEVKKVVPWANMSVARAGLEVDLMDECPF